MTSKIEIDHETLVEYVLEDWFVEETDCDAGKHDTTEYEVVFKFTDDKHYRLSYRCSYSNGIDKYDAPYTAIEVEPVEVKTTKWIVKKEKNIAEE